MATVLVSLVSDQTIQNIRLIKEFKKDVDRYIFISTKGMEKKRKVEAHLSALNITERKISRIIVNEFSFTEIENSLLEKDFNNNDVFLVNITGGTKPMSIVAMSFFSSFNNVKIFYVPIGEGVYRQVYPRIENPASEFSKNISLKEYLLGSNLELIEKEHKISRKIEHAQNLLNQFIYSNEDRGTIDKINRAHNMTNPEDKSYYSGGWFEELIYYKIKNKFSLKENQIAYNVKLQNQKTNNEYDTVFVYNDSIYIVECKAYFGKSGLRAKVEKDLYKLGALDDDFGIKAKAIYITTADIKGNNIKEYQSLMERSKTLNVKLFQLSDLKDDSFLSKL